MESDLIQIIENKLKMLRADCAVKRIHVRDAFGPRYSRCPRQNPDKPSSWDLHWENLQAADQKQRPKDVAEADKRLADFIAESRKIMGDNWPGTDHGRLCWSPFLGGTPIGHYYCQLEECHTGRHIGTAEYCEQMAWPNSPLMEVTSEHQWHELRRICPHDNHLVQGQITICAVCGNLIKEESVNTKAKP